MSMLKNSRVIINFIILLFLTTLLKAADTNETNTVSIMNNINVIIRYYNKKIYYLNTTEDLKLKVSIINNSLEPFSFKLADHKILNLEFEVKTSTNITLEHADEFIIERSRVQYAYYKEITLKTREEYSFIVELNRFAKLDRAGDFSIRARFYPELLTGPAAQGLDSDILPLKILPAITQPQKMELIEPETGQEIIRQPIPPDEVVRFTINARQANEWEKFFLYLDIEKLIINNSNWRQKYKIASEEVKLFMREEYKRLLKAKEVDEEILMIPQSFDIKVTSYDPHKGQVQVREEFWYRDYIEVKQYTYFLERKDAVWQIINYEVLNSGTVRR